MEPATAVVIVKAVLAVGTDKKVWKIITMIAVALSIPVVMVNVCLMSLADGGASYNRSAVKMAFEGGLPPPGMPRDYREYIRQMQQDFVKLDEVLAVIEAMTEGKRQDRYWVKAVFYALYFGERGVSLEEEDYRSFADCFVNYEEKTRVVEEDGNVVEETYIAVSAITDKIETFKKLEMEYGMAVTDEEQLNAVNIWHLAKYGMIAPQEGDKFQDWGDWNGAVEVIGYDLPDNELGAKVLELAVSRLGHPYSQTYRGRENYVDCSYLTMWCYRQVGVILPGTAAEQGHYLVEQKLTIAAEDLQPGDLVFWSHKPNGRYMNITHVGIYAGNGMIVDASYSKGKVVYRNLFDKDKQVLYGRPQ